MKNAREQINNCLYSFAFGTTVKHTEVESFGGCETRRWLTNQISCAHERSGVLHYAAVVNSFAPAP